MKSQKLTTFEIITTLLFFVIMPAIITFNKLPVKTQIKISHAWIDAKLIAMIVVFLVTLPVIAGYEYLTGKAVWVPQPKKRLS